jgi:predicted transcriptional regulator
MKKAKEMEKILKVLANKRRLSIISFLKRRKEAKVGDVAGELRISFKATSKHLGMLFNADVLERDQRNLEMWYRLSPSQNKIVKYISNSLE